MTKLGRYRYWGDRKPDTTRPLLTFTRAQERVVLKLPSQAGENEPTELAAAPTATLRIYGPLDDWGGYWGVSANEVAEALDQLGDVEQVIVRVNSPGGSTFEGRAIMNLLRAHSARCVGVVDGLAASAASYIVVGCDETVMAPGTELMVHDTHTIIYGDAAALRKEADVIDSISRSGSELYADVAGGTAAAWRELQRAETWFTADEAVEAGLANRVGIVPDSGPVETASDEGPVEAHLGEDSDAANRFDLSIFAHAGRNHAPAPAAISRRPQPPTASADGLTQPEGAAVVDFNDTQVASLREQVGFAENADADTIVAAVTEALSEQASDETPTAGAPKGSVVVSKAEWEEMRGDAQRGAAAAQRLHETEREAALDMYRDRYLPANRQSWREEYDRNPKATVEALEKRPVVIPLDELGHELDTGSEPRTVDDVRSEPAYQNWRM